MKSILLVDDEEQVLNSYIRLLRKLDVNLLTAPDGETAFEILESEKVDLILTDIYMEEDGIQLINNIRADSRFDQLPVIVVSGITNIGPLGTAEVVSDLGADLVLNKPVNPEYLVEIIQSFLTEDSH